eukprot:CAMPEP_0118933898 /NCGR_PEP_ID=MMETSP1169-20130426/12906_1 /TAXON_ID=36882 /ORGANISM="Pyramimonas obovata, Strain CCMP722" /LENGTH=503 /DNA_ID=CAMNT_0006876727 /DNA_START=78 /DNA_END=1589 /DNA_ORIENTATION=-
MLRKSLGNGARILNRAAANPLLQQQTARGLAVPAITRKTKNMLAGMFDFSAPAKIPPMTEPMDGVALPTEYTAPKAAPATEITTLANGVRVASENTPGSSVTVGVYIDAGSVNEDPTNQGVSHLLERMAFKTTLNRSHLRFTREVEAIGANLMATATREQMSYTADCLKGHLPAVVELLADTIINPKLHEHEMQAELGKMNGQLQAILNNPGNLVLEVLHSAAFKGGLANQFVWSGTPLTPSAALDFAQKNITGPRVVVAASGCDHKDLLAIAEPLFSTLPKAAAPAVSTTYVGGDLREWSAGSDVHIALGFEMKGGWKNLKNATTISVLSTLMGGGGSFSAGGPGKGMYSRLYTRVLNRCNYMKSCSTFQSGYNDTGLFGLTASADGSKGEDMVKVMVAELQAVAAKGAISDIELSRAKNATISSVLMNLESKAIVTEDIGRQILTYGVRKSPSEFIADVKKVTAADLQACATELLKSPLSMSAIGNIASVPAYDNVVKMLK